MSRQETPSPKPRTGNLKDQSIKATQPYEIHNHQPGLDITSTNAPGYGTIYFVYRIGLYPAAEKICEKSVQAYTRYQRALQERQRPTALFYLEKAIKLAEEGLQMMPMGFTVRQIYARNLMLYYIEKFEERHDMTDLDRAIHCGESLAVFMSAEQIAQIYNDLCYLYRWRYSLQGIEGDLIKAVLIANQAIEMLGSSTNKLPIYQISLAKTYYLRYQRYRSISELKTAIDIVEYSIGELPEDSLEISRAWRLLSEFYIDLLEIEGSESCWEKLGLAIEKAWSALRNSPDVLGEERLIFLNLILSYCREALNRGRDFEHLDMVIQYLEQSAAKDSNNLYRFQGGLPESFADFYMSKYLRGSNKNDLDKAIHFLAVAVEVPNLLPFKKIRIGLNLAVAYMMGLQDQVFGLRLGAEIIKSIPRLSLRHIPHRDLELLVSRIGLKSSKFSAWMVFSDRARNPNSVLEAFNILEAGRGLISSIILDSQPLQTGLSDLEECDQQLFNEYEILKNEIAAISAAYDPRLLDNIRDRWGKEIRVYADVEREMKAIEDKIRMVPGFERFLLPLDLEGIRTLAGDGAIVALNLTSVGSLAIIISKAGMWAIDLPGPAASRNTTLFEEAESRVARMERQLPSRHPKVLVERNKEMKAFLEWLWVNIVRPVLDALDFRVRPLHEPSQLPRIWWMASGILSSVPLHAAGIYGERESESAMDCVVSSYVSTAKALKFARDKLQHQSPDSGGQALLVTASEDDPELDDELQFENEIQGIEETIAGEYRTTILRNSSKKKVLKYIEKSSILHFACHGVSVGFAPYSRKSPSDSYLQLRSFDDERLTVEEIAKVRHSKARLAYLSACSTAKNSMGDLQYEMIHIANAFQLAGFPHVIGTLWETDSEPATIIAISFYKYFLGGGPGSPYYHSAARSLHRAILDMMSHPDYTRPTDFLAWVQFIHIGA